MSVTTQRVAVVTGASSGIGKEAAKALAAQGWRVIALGRDPGRSAAAAAEIRSASSTGKVDMLHANLSLLADVERVAGQIAALTDRVDVLINNAGGMSKARVVTAEGLEENFAGNHLGPFLLTKELLPLLQRAAADAPRGSVRIVNTSSDASEMIRDMPWDDLQLLTGDYNAGLAYCRSKLANVLFARGLAGRLAGDGIVAHAVHPGVVASNFVNSANEQTQAYIRTLDALTPAEGADTLIWLATAAEAGQSNGGYFHLRKPKTPNPVVEDEAAVERLWGASERLVADAGY